MSKQDTCKKCGSRRLIVIEREKIGPMEIKLKIKCGDCGHVFWRYM